MNRKQLENLFEINGLSRFQLKEKDDLLKVFGIKIEQLKGFETLSDKHKEIFTDFLINFYNRLGVDSKLCLDPKSIYFVNEDTLTIQRDKNDEDSWVFVGCTTYVLDKYLKRIKVLKNIIDEDYKYLKKTDAKFERNTEKCYLRFDYNWTYGKKVVKEWLHVIDPNTWY